MKKVKFFAIYFLIPLVLGVIGKTLFFEETVSDKGYHNVTNSDDDFVQAKIPENIDYIFHRMLCFLIQHQCYFS